jgi:hypothetical protein
VVALLTFIMAWILIKAGSIATYTICFVDRDTKEPITGDVLDVYLLQNKRSPVHFTCDTGGCFRMKSSEQSVGIAVHVPFYVPDTISCTLQKSNKRVIVQLKADDYALMLYYFANSKVEDWQNRRKKLEGLIADSAYICQVFRPRMSGIELYNKEEFIDLLTTPAGSLKHMRILEIMYHKDKITTIRFSLDAQVQ